MYEPANSAHATQTAWHTAGLILSYIMTFVIGFLSNRLLQVLQDRQRASRELVTEIYRPLRTQLFKGRGEIESRKQMDAVDLQFWQNMRSTGRDSEVPLSLRECLANLIEQVLPAYRTAWLSGQKAMESLLTRWDEEYGASNFTGRHVPFPNWWIFLSNEDFCPDTMSWDQAPRRIWNRELNQHQLALWHVSIEMFLKDRWVIAQND